MDRKLTEQRFPSSDMLKEYNKINETNEQFMKSLTDPDKGIAASSSVLRLKNNNLVFVFLKKTIINFTHLFKQLTLIFPQ